MRIFAVFIIANILGACQAPPAAPPAVSAEEEVKDPGDGGNENVGKKPTEELPSTKPPTIKTPPGEGEVEQPPPSRIVVTAQMLTDMCTTGPKASKAQTINFPARVTGCSYGQNGNSAQKADYIAARETDSAELTLMKDMMICGIKIESTSPVWHQDEAFYMLDKYLIGTDYGFMTQHFTKENEMYVWDFTKIRDKKREGGGDAYCLGGTDKCEMTERGDTLPLQFNLSNAEIGAFAYEMLEKESLRFEVAVIGGGSSGDCTHTGYDLNVTIDYVTNPNYK
jgi:hypothetical protein